MKLFSLTICLIFGYIISIENNDRIYDIIYSGEYNVDVEKEPITSNNYLFFRLKVDSNEKMGVTIKIVENYDIHFFDVKALGFSEYPNEEDIINVKFKFKELKNDPKRKEGTLIKYIYPIEELTDAKYLVISFDSYMNLKYLSILVSPYKKKESVLFKEITYNQEFIADSETLNSYESFFILWFKNENLENGVVKIKLHKDDDNDLMIILYGMGKLPQQPINASDIVETRFYSEESNSTDSNYITYKYNYEKFTEKSKYIVFYAMSLSSSFKYFSVYIGREQISNELPNSYKISGLNAYSLFALLLLLF